MQNSFLLENYFCRRIWKYEGKTREERCSLAVNRKIITYMSKLISLHLFWGYSTSSLKFSCIKTTGVWRGRCTGHKCQNFDYFCTYLHDDYIYTDTSCLIDVLYHWLFLTKHKDIFLFYSFSIWRCFFDKAN